MMLCEWMRVYCVVCYEDQNEWMRVCCVVCYEEQNQVGAKWWKMKHENDTRTIAILCSDRTSPFLCSLQQLWVFFSIFFSSSLHAITIFLLLFSALLLKSPFPFNMWSIYKCWRNQMTLNLIDSNWEFGLNDDWRIWSDLDTNAKIKRSVQILFSFILIWFFLFFLFFFLG